MISTCAKDQLVMFGTGFRAAHPWFVRPQGYYGTEKLPGHMWAGQQGSHAMSRTELSNLV